MMVNDIQNTIHPFQIQPTQDLAGSLCPQKQWWRCAPWYLLLAFVVVFKKIVDSIAVSLFSNPNYSETSKLV